MMELSKSEKKIARAIIQKGLKKEFESGMQKFYEILSEWKNKGLDSQENYYLIYEAIHKFDKHIELRYNDMRGSDYIFIIAAQLAEGIISETDIQQFKEETNQKIKLIANH